MTRASSGGRFSPLAGEAMVSTTMTHGGERAETHAPDYDEFRTGVLHDLDLVYTVARLVSGSARTAGTVLPDLMLDAFRKWSFRPSGVRPRVWVMQLLLKRIGTDVRESGLDGSDSRPGRWEPGEEISALELRQTMCAMTRQDREVLALGDIAGLRYQEIGAVLGIDRSDVTSRLFGARARLRRRLRGPRTASSQETRAT